MGVPSYVSIVQGWGGVDFWDAVLFFWVKLMCFHDMVVFFLIV